MCSPLKENTVVPQPMGPEFERMVMATVAASEARGDPPWVAAATVGQCCVSDEKGGSGFPNADLACALVSNLCFSHNTPYMWKLLEQTMVRGIVYPLHALALLTPRVILHRRVHPEAYRLYLELMRQYFYSPLLKPGACREKIINSIDACLQLSHIYHLEKVDFGMVIVLFVLRVITTLVDCLLEDCGLQFASKCLIEDRWPHPIDIEPNGQDSSYRCKNHGHMIQTNGFTALEVLENMTTNKRIQVFLRLIHLNMPESFDRFCQRLQFIEENMSSAAIFLSVKHLLEKFFSNVKEITNAAYRPYKCSLQRRLDDTITMSSPLPLIIGFGKVGCWISFDILMENAMDGRKTLCPIAAFKKLAELTTKLHIINQASWQETFEALWISALRLVQRAREPVPGPVPHLDSRLCLLLSIVPLSIAILLKEENCKVHEGAGDCNIKQGLVACFQSLLQFTSLLSPPQPVIEAANDAATKAAVFISESKMPSGDVGMLPQNNSSRKAVGSLLHLMVEACIARDLLDTSAYFWPGYVVLSIVKTCPQSVLIQDSPWTNFMQGAPLTESLQSALIAIPAPSVAELKKLTHLALNGSEKERLAAPKILCAASLIHGWNIQEHTVRTVVNLLSPPFPTDAPATEEAQHFSDHMHMLTATLASLCQTDIVHILWLHGMIPEVVAALIPLCEVFGSLQPPPPICSSASKEVSIYAVFSFAFLFLLRLYKFYLPSQGHYSSGRTGPVCPELTLDYFLLVRNAIIPDKFLRKNVDCIADCTDSLYEFPRRSIYIDSFPKLRAWYCQNEACVASIISGLCNPMPVLHVADRILNMIFGKEKRDNCWVRSSSSMDPDTDNSSLSSGTTTGDSSFYSTNSSISDDQFLPLLPAWQMLEATPMVLEALLAACANGKLSSRQLTTGLRDLVNFFPASVAAIVSYFSAEITRGIWKDVPMNGTDWPSPCETLYTFESEVKEVLASAGVHIQSCYPRCVPPMLPLPLAALLSLFITFRLDKNLAYARVIVGRALINHSVHSNWPRMLVCGAIGYQKVRMWQNFLIITLSYSAFTHDRDAVVQLMRGCFRAFLGPIPSDSSSVTSTHGVCGLLGCSLSNTLSPGILFLRTYHLFHDPHFFTEVILKLVIESACNLAPECALGSATRLRSGLMSLTGSFSTAQQVAVLGATLLYAAGQALLVQVLFEETVPTLLLSACKERSGSKGFVSSILEGYAISYLMFFSSAFIPKVSPESNQLGNSKRLERIIATHVNFMARVFEHNIVLNCDPILWKTHVRCFLGLVVRFAPSWIQSLKLDVLKKLSNGLRGWQEHDLAFSLLELGGVGAIEVVVESIL